MILDYPENLKGKDLYEFLLNVCVQRTDFEKKRDRYDAGKYGYHIQKLEKYIYGCYYQSYDSAEGDNWKMYIYKVTDTGIEVIAVRNDDSRFFYNTLFQDELGKIPYDKIR